MFHFRGDEAGEAMPLSRQEEGRLLAAKVPEGQGQLVAEAAKGIAVRRGGEPVEKFRVLLQQEHGDGPGR